MNRIVGAYTSFAPLRKALVGTFHPVSYFDDLPDSPFRDRMRLISEQTHTDLNQYIKLLEEYNIEVHTTRNFFDKPQVVSNGITSVINPRPPITPADNVCFVDNKMFSLFTHPQPMRYFDDYAHHELFAKLASQGVEWHQMPKGYHDAEAHKGEYWLKSKGDKQPYLDAANLLKLGNRIYFTNEWTSNNLGMQWFKNILGDRFKFIELHDKERFVDHIDSMVKVVRPGLVLSKFAKKYVTAVIPEMEKWDFIHLPDEKQRVKEYLVRSNTEMYWEEASKWSAEWLTEWVDSDVLNTVFDVNVVSIDNDTVIISEANAKFERLLKNYDITVISCPFRHRYFWGHALSCLMADMLREDECIDYFN